MILMRSSSKVDKDSKTKISIGEAMEDYIGLEDL